MERLEHDNYVIVMGRDGSQAACAALELRARVFRNGADDRDIFDARMVHVAILNLAGVTLAAFRVLAIGASEELNGSYSAAYYDLTPLKSLAAPCLEVGRFCANPDVTDPNVIRLTWDAIAKLAETEKAEMLFGCSSFVGNNPEDISQALAFLAQKYVGPEELRPNQRAPKTVALELFGPLKDRKIGLLQLPPLLKAYLKMGAWVSDHAVIDRDLGTIHVFTGLEVAKIPAARVSSVTRA